MVEGVSAQRVLRHRQGGPPLGVLAGVSTGLLVAALVTSALLGGVVPSPYASAEVIRGYFLSEPDAVRASGVLLFGSSVPLAIYAATVSARLRQLGVTAPGATIALAGGLLSAGALTMSGLLQWTLSRPAVRGDEPLVRALHDLAFLTGGPAHVVFLGLLVAGIAVPGLLLRLLPRPLGVAGLAIAALAELCTLTLVWPDLSVLLPIARFPALAWLITAGLLLPRRRPPRDSRPESRQTAPPRPAAVQSSPSDAAGGSVGRSPCPARRTPRHRCQHRGRFTSLRWTVVRPARSRHRDRRGRCCRRGCRPLVQIRSHLEGATDDRSI